MDTRDPQPIRWCGLFILAVLVSILTGCALTAPQKAAVGQFSDASATLGDVTSSELRAMRGGTVKMTIERLLLGGKSKDPNLGDQASLDHGFDLERVETVSGALSRVASCIHTLARQPDRCASAV